MSKAVGPYQDGTGLYFVSWTSRQGEYYERWYHTYTVASRWLADIQVEHP
jgi:hypothetical protein